MATKEMIARRELHEFREAAAQTLARAEKWVSFPAGVSARCSAVLTGNARSGFAIFRAWTVVIDLGPMVYSFDRGWGDILAANSSKMSGLADGEHALLLGGVTYRTLADAPAVVRAAAEAGFVVLCEIVKRHEP